MGHSERRHTVAAESDELIAEKTKVALANGIKVILCIGELLEDRENGNTMKVCKAQLQAVVDKVEEKDWENIVIAYEPVWAIGTGKVATPDQAEETHAQIRAFMASSERKNPSKVRSKIRCSSLDLANTVRRASPSGRPSSRAVEGKAEAACQSRSISGLSSQTAGSRPSRADIRRMPSEGSVSRPSVPAR